MEKTISGKSVRRTAAALAVLLALGAGSCRGPRKPDWVKAGGAIEAAKVDAASFPYLARWLDRSAMDPVDYIVEKCRAHDLVIVGEQHYVSDYCRLFARAAVAAYDKAGLRVVALEVCNAEDNAKLARLVEGPTYDLDLAYEIARAENWELWGYREYWDILKAVWEANRSRTPGRPPLRVVGVDKAMDFQLDALNRAGALKDPALIAKAKALPDIYKRDNWMQENLERETLRKGEKGLVLIGLHHSFTRYAQPKLGPDLKLEREWPRMANVLARAYGDRVFQVVLHGPQMSPSILDKTYKGPEPVLSGLLERIMAARGGAPAAFDVAGSPFAGLRDGLSYYFHWQPRVTFADLCQGYVFLKPFGTLTPCGWMDGFISDRMIEKSGAYYEFAYGRKFKDSREANEFFAAGLKKL